MKSGRDLEARTLNRPSRNIVIRNCRFRGFESSHLDNISIRNVDIRQAEIPVHIEHVDNLKMEMVSINGKDYSLEN